MVSFFSTIWHRPVRRRVPLYWLGGALFMILVGGAMGLYLFLPVMQELARHDDPMYIVLNSTLKFAGIFVFFALIYHGFDKISQRRYREWAGKLHFGLALLGVNLLSLPQHLYKPIVPQIS